MQILEGVFFKEFEWKFDKSVGIIQGKLLMLAVFVELSELSVIKRKGWETTYFSNS